METTGTILSFITKASSSSCDDDVDGDDYYYCYADQMGDISPEATFISFCHFKAAIQYVSLNLALITILSRNTSTF